MLPLVRRIVTDILGWRQGLREIPVEKPRLDRPRHTLGWPDRRRRYHLTDEITRAETELQAARAELDALGLPLLDEADGLIGFPTMVNNQRAFFSWKPGE